MHYIEQINTFPNTGRSGHFDPIGNVVRDKGGTEH